MGKEGAVSQPVAGLLEAWASRSRSDAPRVQAKLMVGEPGDAFEREADAFAAVAAKDLDAGKRGIALTAGAAGLGKSGLGAKGFQVQAHTASDVVQPSLEGDLEKEKTAAEEIQTIRPKLHFGGGSGGGTEAPPNLPDDIGQLRGNGSGLPAHLRGHFEGLLGSGLGGVRIHRGARSAEMNRQLGARAFTLGQDIFFGQGQYDAGSADGQALLAHEVAHTVQQGNGEVVRRQPWGRTPVTSVPASCYPGVSVKAIERENRAKLRFFEERLHHMVVELKGKTQHGLKAAILEEIDRLDLTDSYIRAEIGTILSTQLTNDGLILDVMQKLQGMARDQQVAKQVDQSTQSQGIRSPLVGPIVYTLADVACSLPDGIVRLVEAPPIFIDGLIEGMRGSVSSDEIAKIADKLTDWDAIAMFPINFSAGFVYGLGETVVKIGREIIDLITDPAKAIKEIFDLVMALASEGGNEIAMKMGMELGKTIGKEIGNFADQGASAIVREIGRLLAPLLAVIIIMLMGRVPPRGLIKPEVSKLSKWIVSIKRRLLHRKRKRVKGETDWPLVDHRLKKNGVVLVSEEEHWDILEKLGKFPADQLNPNDLGIELEFVKATKPIQLKPSASGFVEEVRLPNGRTWRKHEDGSWTRFPEGTRYQETPNGLVLSPKPSRFVGKAIKTVEDLRRAASAQKPVGRFMKDEAQARDVMQKLAKNDPTAWDTLGIDMKGERFDSDKLEWGLAYDPSSKEYFVIRGNDPTKGNPGAVDWKDYIGKTDIVGHSHPYFDHVGAPRKLKFDKGKASLDEILKDADNQALLLPSPEDLKFMVDFKQGTHTVVTPYRWDPIAKQIVNPDGPSNLPNIVIDIEKPTRLGTSEIFERDVTEARVKMSANGKPIDADSMTLYMVDTAVGPMLSVEKPLLVLQHGPMAPLNPPVSLMDDVPGKGTSASVQALQPDKLGSALAKVKAETNEAGRKQLDRVESEAKVKGDVLQAKEFDYIIDPDVQGVRRSGPDAIGKAQGIEKPEGLKIADLRGADDFTLAAVMHAQAKSHGGGMNIGNLFLGENTANTAHGYWENIALALARSKKKVRIRGVAVTNQDHAGRFFHYVIEVDGKQLLNGWIDPTKVIGGLNVPGPGTFTAVAKKLFGE
jgi:Domain of unknown function (DUF4157)